MFPSVINTFNIVAPSNRLDSPSHSALHNSVSSVVTQLQTVIGVEGANSVVGTLEYLIKSPASDGGGHVQSAVKGGTGQTTLVKGNLLVASGPSTLSKLTVGADGQVLAADSTTATGVKWGGSLTKIYETASVISILNNVPPEYSILSATIPASTLGSNNAVRATVFMRQAGAGGSVMARVYYGGDNVSSLLIRSNSASLLGTISYNLLADASPQVQRGILQVNLNSNNQDPGLTASASIAAIRFYQTNTSSIQSDVAQTLGITLKYSAANSDTSIDGSLVEKII